MEIGLSRRFSNLQMSIYRRRKDVVTPAPRARNNDIIRVTAPYASFIVIAAPKPNLTSAPFISLSNECGELSADNLPAIWPQFPSQTGSRRNGAWKAPLQLQ